MFGVEDVAWTDSPGSRGSARGDAPQVASDDTGSPAPEGGVHDEIRQGDGRDRQRRPMPAGLTRMRDRLAVGARRMSPAQIAISVAALVVVAFVAGVLVGRRSPQQPAVGQAGGIIGFTPTVSFPPGSSTIQLPGRVSDLTTGPLSTVAPTAVYAMQLKSTPVNQARQSQEIRDAGATQGPWSVIVRRTDGSLGRHGAVITYPVPSLTTGRTVRIGSALRRVAPGASCVGRTVTNCTTRKVAAVIGHVDKAGGIVWPLNGRFARIRGDLGSSMLSTLAARVAVRKGHPSVAGLPTGIRVIVSEPYRAPVVTESRYTDSLRVDSGPIDGLIYSEVVIGGASFEEALYSEDTVVGGAISGHLAVRSPVGGGSATLAWEVAPGIVAFVGYAGGLVPSAATASLTELARGGHLLGHAQWRTTHPSTTRGENDYS